MNETFYVWQRTAFITSIIALTAFGLDLQGPLFVSEPPHRVEFSSGSGARIDCTAHGSPQPEVEWIFADGSQVYEVQELRLLFPNGSMSFPAFAHERFRSDVHSNLYRCKLKSPLGVVVSRDVHVKAVVAQKYEVSVNDEYVTSGNTAVLRCKVPNYVSEYAIVTSWLQDGSVNIYPNTDIGGKYVVLNEGDLYVSNVGPADGYKSYVCRTVHRLTGEVQVSTYPGRIIVNEPAEKSQPRINVDRLNAKRIIVGDDVTLPCVAHGHPVPTYRWQRELQGRVVPITLGERLTILSAGLLKIHKVRLEDRGAYVCHANNSWGEETARVVVEVTAPLSAHVQPQVQLVDVGRDANFLCIAHGHPINRIDWLHDGKPIAPDVRVEIMTNPPRLSIKQLVKDDHGMYQCVISNNFDQAQAIAELDMGDAKPELSYWFSEQTLQPGPTVSLKCVANGNPPPRFSWTLDGFPIPDHPRFLVGQYVTVHDDVISHVNITNIKAEDGGLYMCTAHNNVGSVSHGARVNVYGLPYIREMPKITGVAGSSLVVKCPVAGYPIETITWERDGQTLPVNRRQRVYANGTLVVEQTQVKEDAGTYTCQAQNRQRNSARRNVEVQVIVPPKILPINPMTGLLREGMRAAINCQVMEGDLPLTFRWERNGKIISDDDALYPIVRRIDEFSSSLIIDQVTSAHTGNYSCIASNSAGHEKYVVPLTVNVPPRWTVEPSDTNVASTQEAILHCQASGFPNPIITWKKAVDGQPGEYKDFLFQPNVQQYENGSLLFTHISKENEGQYLCEAKNSIGTGVSKVIVLKVNAPARFQQKSKQVQVVKGEQAHLQCTALGDTPMDIQWKVAGQHISNEENSRYTIRIQELAGSVVSELSIERTIRQDTGIFTCSAKNGYGGDDMNIQLIVQEIPEPPKNLRIIEQLSRSVKISWTQPYAGNSPIKNYIIQYKDGLDDWPSQPAKILVPGSQTVSILPDLHPAQIYHVRILAENRLGLSDPSQVVQANTLEEVPTGAPLEIRTEAKSSTELGVSWKPPPQDSWNGNLLGYHVGFAELNQEQNYAGLVYTFRSVEVRNQFKGEANLQGLKKYTIYSIVVQAYNSRGSGPSSDPVTARTLEDIPTLPPENLQCSTLSAQSLHVSWEPPKMEGRNGVIQGYKITYHSLVDWLDSDDQQTKNTAQLRTTLLGLRKYTNYSITALAYTSAGDGVQTKPVFCLTEEDIPMAPSDIKAAYVTTNKILISWLPPAFSNGELVGYTFYMNALSDGKEEHNHKRALSSDITMHEVVKFQEQSVLQFWVTASTRIGEGEKSRKISIAPSKNVPARIASFGTRIVTASRYDVTLDCKVVGIPTPTIRWTIEDGPLEVGGRKSILPNSTLIIKDAQKGDQGNYSCLAENQYGHDQIVYILRVLLAPEAPILDVVESFSDSLHLRWNDRGNGGSSITGYVINYKKDHGDWEEMQIVRTHSYMLSNLSCGTTYLLYITAFNRIGTGLPCDIITTKTKGTTPIKPKPSQVLTMNATAVTVWLDSWADGGCAILYFVLEYKASVHSTWLTASNYVKPTERIYSIGDLWPGNEYFVRITAHNNAGSTEGIYNFTTLSVSDVPPDLIPPHQHSEDQPIYAKAKVWLTALLLLVIILVFSVSFMIYKKKKRGREIQEQSIGETSSIAQLQNKQNSNQQYLAFRVRPPQSIMDSTLMKSESGEYIEDICPYATFQLTKPTFSESSYSGNIYSGPYHSVQGSFVYHDVKPPPTDMTIQKKDHEYMKVRRKGRRPKDPHSESQESDNLGSTDSEVKKILTLHLPISEYDTLGSDSEGDGRATSQELMAFNHRIKGSAEGTSSSSELSLRSNSIGRKACPSKRTKPKAQALGKRHVRSSSGYSSHNEETTLSISHTPNFPERLQPPNRFFNVSSLEISEANADRPHRREASRLRGDAFQINV